MRINKQSPWFRYGLAIALFLVVIVVSSALKYFFGSTNLAILVFFFLMVASWYGGLGPGLLLAILIEVTTVIFNPKPPEATYATFIFGHVTINFILLSFVWLVSSRKRADDRLREKHELLQTTLSSIGDAVIATDMDGKVSFINPTAETLTGWPHDEAAGKPLSDVYSIISEETREPVESPFDAIKRHGLIVGLANHTILISKDGKEIPIDDSGSPIKNSKGAVVGAIVVFHDVSERRKTELERETLLVREQTARSEAETANRLKDEFLAMVSHELRTPLNAILGWAALLESDNKMEEATVRKALGIIERNAKAQNDIISDILDVSRIVTGQLQIHMQPVELVPALRAAVETMYLTAEAKSISISTAFFDSNCKIIGDSVRIQQIFSNILSNAVKFTPKGGQINVRLIQTEAKVEILVSDNGVGIPKSFIGTVFNRFRQADSSMKRTHGGLGLGLAIVRHLVELHGGNVSVASEGEGKGSTFTVEFELMKASKNSEENSRFATNVPDLVDLRVLVVDDDPDTLEVLCRILEKYGAQTHGASSCMEALELFHEWRPNILVSDLGMPGEDGYDLISKVRTLPDAEGGRIPAAALTAYVREEDCLDALAAGYQVHIPKPVEPYRLATEVAGLSRNGGHHISPARLTANDMGSKDVASAD
jgi:PAS domain S-box-containing protein